jgi:hypothetical protein
MKNHITSALTLAVSLVLAQAASAQIQGPSSSATPYVVPSGPNAANTTVTSIITVGDSVNLKPGGITPYRMVGIPDGMGAFDNNDGTFTVLLNHEIGSTVGVTRAHGSAGSFVSKWVINKSNFSVVSGSDLIQNVNLWNGSGYTTFNAGSPIVTGSASPAVYNAAIGRLCSGDLAPVSAYFNSLTGKGTQARIFQSGEEIGAEGRQFAHIATGAAAGTSYELPRLGKFSWENGVANGGTGDKTIVLGTDDTTPGQVYLYIGDKQSTGNDVEKAGLTNGNLWGIKAPLAIESRTNGLDGVSGNKDSVAFTLHSFGNVENTTGATLQSNSIAAGVTDFLRPEDIAWSLTDVTKAYFVTTDRFHVDAGTPGASRLWELDFSDANDFTAGGTLKMLIEGTGAADGQMFDNMTVTLDGKIIIQEDPGNNAYLAKTWSYDIATDTLSELLVSDPARFTTPTAPFSLDEESSGVIDISDIMGVAGTSYYLGNMQAHYGLGGELVEGGQLYVVAVVPEPSTALSLLGGLGMLLGLRRRRSA